MKIVNRGNNAVKKIMSTGAGRVVYGAVSFVVKPGIKSRRLKALKELDAKYGDTLNDRKKWKRCFRRWIMQSNSENIDKVMRPFYVNPLRPIKEIDGTVPDSPDIPIIVCVIQNEMARLPELLSHYRGLGIERFVFIDNSSDDGSVEYLSEQKDATVYSTTDSFDHKLAWINRAIDSFGKDRWYLEIDGDEFLAYPEMDEKNIPEYIKAIEKKGIRRVRGFMLNLYPKGNLKTLSHDPKEFRKHFVYYDADSDDYIYYTDLDRLCSGSAKRLFDSDHTVLSKTPLFFADRDFLAMTAHENFPIQQDHKADFGLVLLHYKFLPNEEQRIRDYAASGVHDRDSELYKHYQKFYDGDGKSLYFKGSREWTGAECLKEFEVIRALADT